MGRVWLRARSACPSPFPVLVCGVDVRAGVRASPAPRLSLGGCWGVCVLVRRSRLVSCTSCLGLLCEGACLCAHPACSPPFLVGVRCVGVRAWPGSRLCPALVAWVVGVCFLRYSFLCVLVWLYGVGCCLSLYRALWSLSAHLLSFGLGCCLLFFFQRSVCLHASMSLSLLGRCSWLGVAGFGFVVPLCLFWGPVFGAFRVGGLAASCGVGGRFGGCGLFSRPPPPSHPCFISFWGGACLFLPLASLGWRTHWPAFSVVFRAAVGGCILLGRVPAPWVRWAMYTFSPAPLPAGLGPGSAGLAAAPGGCSSGLEGWGCPLWCRF